MRNNNRQPDEIIVIYTYIYNTEVYQRLVEKLRKERIDWLKQFKELDREILEIIAYKMPDEEAI